MIASAPLRRITLGAAACLVAAAGVCAAQASAPASAPAAAPGAGEARGVNPADNITKFEILPRVVVIDDGKGISSTTVTLKYDRAIRGIYGVNIEVPLARFEDPGGGRTGLADLNLRGRYQFALGRGIGIIGGELVLPIATDEALGAGKVQVDPTVVCVHPLSSRVFAAALAKHVFSMAGSDDRADLPTGQYRVLGAYSSPRGWWALADSQMRVDYTAARRAYLQLEGEVGRTVAISTDLRLIRL